MIAQLLPLFYTAAAAAAAAARQKATVLMIDDDDVDECFILSTLLFLETSQLSLSLKANRYVFHCRSSSALNRCISNDKGL